MMTAKAKLATDDPMIKTMDGASDNLLEQTKAVYLDSLRLIERLHRRLLDVIKTRLDEIGRTDINSVQALLLYNIGENEMTAGELRTRGYYLGSNVSYNLKKMVEADYIMHERSAHDRRSVRVRLSPKGMEICKMVNTLYDEHVEALGRQKVISQELLNTLNTTLRDVERFWAEQLRYGMI